MNLNIPLLIITALMTLGWFVRWVQTHRRRLPARGKGKNAPAGPEHRFSGRDWAAMLSVTAVFAAAVFTGLGSHAAPQTFRAFDAGDSTLIELNEPQALTLLRYYTGRFQAGGYTLSLSGDGQTWTELTGDDGGAAMPQDWPFSWGDIAPDGAGPVRYIRVTSLGAQSLGELALYGADGRLLPADAFAASDGELFDEQDTVPERDSLYFNGAYFDESFYVHTALDLTEGVWPHENTHPPLAKSILALGVRLFGLTPFGWRFMGALFGILTLPALYILLKKMFGYTSVPACGTAVFALGFIHYVQARIATIDTYAVFFILLMYLFMYLWLTAPAERRGRLVWLGLSGLSFGLGAACKWTCLYAGAGLGMIWAAYWAARFGREKKKARSPFSQNVLWCLLFFVAIPAAVYYASYWPYAGAAGITGPMRMFTADYPKLVMQSQRFMWRFHSTNADAHWSASRWYQWLFDLKPAIFIRTSGGARGCVASFVNPIVCWGGLLAMGGAAYIAVRERDERARFILIGYLANLLPWVFIRRITFAYHYYACSLFLVLALAYLFFDLRRRDAHWRLSIGGFTAACAALFALFYPVLRGLEVGGGYMERCLTWLDSWAF